MLEKEKGGRRGVKKGREGGEGGRKEGREEENLHVLDS